MKKREARLMVSCLSLAPCQPVRFKGKAGLVGGGATGSLLQKQDAGKAWERLSLPAPGLFTPLCRRLASPSLPWVLQLSPDPSQGWAPISLP